MSFHRPQESPPHPLGPLHTLEDPGNDQPGGPEGALAMGRKRCRLTSYLMRWPMWGLVPVRFLLLMSTRPSVGASVVGHRVEKGQAGGLE